jgi:hypothetical protein
MDETDAVLRRLARIERLRAAAQPAAVLAELRLLVPEAEAWARAEGDARARAAVQSLGVGLGRRAVTNRPVTNHPVTELRERAEGMR